MKSEWQLVIPADWSVSITVVIVFKSFLCSLARSKYLYIFFVYLFACLFVCLFFHFLSVVRWNGKIYRMSIFFLFNLRISLLTGIEWSVCIAKFQKIFASHFSWKNSGLCIYHLAESSNFNLLHNSQWITLSTQSCLVLYSFFTNLLHSLIMWSIISSLSLHNMFLLFCCVLSIW